MANFKLFLSEKYPDYDPDRYHFRSGDVVRLNCGAIFIVRQSLVDRCEGFIHKRSLVHREFGPITITMDELPNLRCGEFVQGKYYINKKIKWSVGDVVIDPRYGKTVYLYANAHGPNDFYGYVLGPEDSYYIHTGIYLDNPYKDYIIS